jgi:hypothetical protein
MWQERLRSAMRQWQASNRDEGALLRGAPLAEAEQWQQERTLAPEEQRFIHTSLDLHDREQQEREARQQRELELARKAVREEQQRVAIQTRAKKRLRAWLAIVTLLVIITFGMTVWAYWSFKLAYDERINAEKQRVEAIHERINAEKQGAEAIHQSRISLIRSLVAYSLQEDAQASRQELPEDVQASRERAALLARLASLLNDHFEGGVEVQTEIDEALRTIFRTKTITAGYGHEEIAAHEKKGKALVDLVCQSVNFKTALELDELKPYVDESIDEELTRVLAEHLACPPEEPDKPLLLLRSEPMVASSVFALSLNLWDEGPGGIVQSSMLRIT